MKTPQLPEVNWCELYGKLAEAVDHLGYSIVRNDKGYIDLMPKQVGEVQGDARAQFEAWAAGDGFDVNKVKGIYTDPLTRGAWDAWRYLAARQTETQEAIAWQINAKRSGWGWENCTRECYEDTLRTGRYMGLPAGARDVEVRQLYAARQPVRNDGTSEADFVADGTDLNCPSCGGSGHIEDANSAAVEQPVYFSLDMDGTMVPDEDGEWVRR